MRSTTLTHTPHHSLGRKGHLRLHRQIVPPALQVSDSAAASVFRAVRLRGPVGRDVIAGVTSLSIATVNRQVIATRHLSTFTTSVHFPVTHRVSNLSSRP